MSQVLGALAEVFSKQRLGFLLEDVRLVGRNAVPKLGLPLMKVVDGREVEVFPVPAEESLP